jgi:ferredoxin-NADP reductase
MTPIKIPLVQRRQISQKVLEVTCEVQDQKIQFSPGQHFKVSIENLLFPDQKGKTRIFNAVSSPNNEHYISFAFLMSDSGFKKTINQIPLGTKLEIKGPYGMFMTSKNETRHTVMVGDDIGITPCISHILYAIEEGLINGMHLLYSSNCPYAREIKEIQQGNKNLRCFEFNDFNLAVIKKIDNYKECLWCISGTVERIGIIKQQLLKANVPIQNIKVEEFAGY